MLYDLGGDELPIAAFIPGTASIGFSAIAGAGGFVEVLIDEAGSRGDAAHGEGGFAEAFESGGEGLHVGDLAGHQELQGVDGAGVVGEVDEAFVDDFGVGFGGDVAAEIDIEFAGDLQVVGGPGVADGVAEADSSAAGDGLRSGSSQFSPWMEYCMAAASSPLAPPNCSSTMLPKRGSGAPMWTVYISCLT
jgi:hypothetical protein